MPRFRQNQVAGHLTRMVADAGTRYVAVHAFTRPRSLLMDCMEQRARSTLQADTLEWARAIDASH